MKIRAIAHALPKKSYSIEQIAEWTASETEFIRNKVGAVNRYYLDPDETGSELAHSAVQKLLSEENVNISEIGLLVYVTQTPDCAIPHNSAILHGMLSGPKEMACFDVGLGCSGYPYALSIAKSMMSAEQINKALVVTCDPYSKIMDKHDKSTVTVFGDAATATLLDSNGRISIGKTDFGTLGAEGTSALHLAAGNASKPIWSIHKETATLDSNEPNDYRLQMNGRNVFNFVMTEIPKSLENAAKINGISMKEVDLFALHQGSLYMLENLIRRTGIDNSKVIFNIQKFGNTVSSSLPLVLEEIIRERPGFVGNVLISGFGVGVSWASNILKFEPY